MANTTAGKPQAETAAKRKLLKKKGVRSKNVAPREVARGGQQRGAPASNQAPRAAPSESDRRRAPGIEDEDEREVIHRSGHSYARTLESLEWHFAAGRGVVSPVPTRPASALGVRWFVSVYVCAYTMVCVRIYSGRRGAVVSVFSYWTLPSQPPQRRQAKAAAKVNPDVKVKMTTKEKVKAGESTVAVSRTHACEKGLNGTVLGRVACCRQRRGSSLADPQGTS